MADTLGDLFNFSGEGITADNPPQAPDPVTPPVAAAPQSRSLFEGIAGGITAGLSRNPFQAFEYLEAQRRTDIAQQQQVLQEKQQAISLANTMTNVMKIAQPGLRAVAIKNWAISAGMDEKDPKIKGLMDFAKQLDERGAQLASDVIAELGINSPNAGAILEKLTDPEEMIKFGGMLAEHERKLKVDDIIAQSRPKIETGAIAGNMPSQTEGGEQTAKTPAQQIQNLGRTISQLSALRSKIATIDPTHKQIPVLNAEINDLQQEVTRLQTGENQLRIEERSLRREDQAERRMDLQVENMNRLAGQFQQAQAQALAIQDRIDKRAEEYRNIQLYRPLEQTDREAVAAMEENLIIAKKLKNDFSPAERQRFVGILKNPAQRLRQFFRDPNSEEAKKFAEFQTLTNQVKGFAFAEGGKNLTATEKAITWGHLPVGNEFSVADYVSNLDRTVSRTESLIKRRVELATTPRNRITPQSSGSGGGGELPEGSTLIGRTKQGKPVYKTPDGKQLVVE